MNNLQQTCRILPQIALVTLALSFYSNAQELQIVAVDDVIQNWSSMQHLYVKGDLGIGSDQLDRLENWLDENAQHWTVVLMRNADGEVYRSTDGRNLQGIDAVEMALGQGLPNRTRFGEWEHPATGETDGAVFVLFLDEQVISYYGSVAQDRRQLGWTNWIRGLNREAIRAMRNGGRIVDAVKNTVKLIDGKLQRAIAAEALHAARVTREREASRRRLERIAAEARSTLIEEVELESAKLRKNYPAADGVLTKPPVDQWRGKLDAKMERLNADNLRSTEQDVRAIIDEIQGYLDIYAAHESMEAMSAEVKAGVEKIGFGPNAVAEPMISEANSLLEAAHQAHASGLRDFVSLVRKAKDQLDEARIAIDIEAERLRVAAARDRLIRQTALGASSIATLGVGIGLVLLNRRRRPAKQRAAAALAEREKSIEAEMDKVYGLIERSSQILGSKEKVAARGYAGVTRRLSDRTLEDVDDLLVMSTEVERVMDEARSLIEPASPAGKISNMFGGSRYERGIHRISGEPLEFTHAKGLPLVIKRDADSIPDGPSNSAGGNVLNRGEHEEQPESLSMTFEEVFAAFHERSASASETLDLIERSLLDVNDRLVELQSRINHVSDLDSRLVVASETDSFFPVPALFDEAIPAAQAEHDAADAISATDPVRAVQEYIPTGWRIVTESLSIAENIDYAREGVFPKLDRSSPKLETLGHETSWMERNVRELGDRANRLFQIVSEESIEEMSKVFSNDVSTLGERAEESVVLAERLVKDCGPAMDTLAATVVTARAKVADALGIPESSALREHERDPDQCSAKAQELFSAASAALDHGDVEGGGRAIRVLGEQVTKGHQFISNTLNSLAAFESDLRSCANGFASVQKELPTYETLVSENESAFAPSALVLQAGDPATPDATATIGLHLREARALLEGVERMIGEATASHRQGKVLEAAAMLVVANSSIDEAEALFEEIAKHCALLESRIRQNLAELTRMVQRTEDLAERIRDERTQRPTISRFERVVRDIQATQRDVEDTTSNRDPFRDAAIMNQLVQESEAIDSLVDADRNAHAEASRAVNGAKAQHRTAEELARESRSDQIPDSSAVQTYQREVHALGDALAATERRLRVAHEDWQSVDADAARINADLGIVAGQLRDELKMAQQSVEALKLASQEVFDATRWTGGFGVRVTGSPGSHELERARHALKIADYAQMLQMSRAAIMSARQAVQMAQREVARHEREAARIAEAARRRRRASAAQRAAHSGSILGGRRSVVGNSRPNSGGSNSSGAWTGRSRSPTNSGFGRSGW